MNARDWWWGFGQQQQAKPINWEDAARFTWCILNCVRIIEGRQAVPWPESRAPAPAPAVEMPRTPAVAAKLLGVSVDATPDAIRAALRAKIGDGAHPDHGGDESVAKQLIAAKNLLIEHARRAS